MGMSVSADGTVNIVSLLYVTSKPAPHPRVCLVDDSQPKPLFSCHGSFQMFPWLLMLLSSSLCEIILLSLFYPILLVPRDASARTRGSLRTASLRPPDRSPSPRFPRACWGTELHWPIFLMERGSGRSAFWVSDLHFCKVTGRWHQRLRR